MSSSKGDAVAVGARHGLRRATRAAVLVALAGGCAAPQPVPPLPGKSLSGIPVARMKPGSPWTGWDDAREPLVTFEFTRGWTLECPADATAEFSRASDSATDGRFAGRLTASATNTIARVLLRPPAPLPIPEPFDSVEIRLSAGGDTAPAGAAPRPSVRVAVEEGEGAIRVVDLGRFPLQGWHLAHRRLVVEPPIGGARLLGLEILEWENPAAHPLYLAGLTFYTESRVPIVPSWRMAPLDPAPTFVQTLRAKAAEPLPAEPPASGASVVLDADAGFAEFVVPGLEGRLAYRLRLGPGLGPVEALYEGERVGAFTPPVWSPEGARAPDRIVSARRAGECAIAVEFESGRRAQVALVGRSLVADLASDRRNIAFVEASGWVPGSGAHGRMGTAFLNAGGWVGPSVHWIRPSGALQGLAICSYLDPHYSRASRWEMNVRPEGGMQTLALYDEPALGRRSAIRERVVWAISERMEEVLPRIPPENRMPRALPAVPVEWMLDADEIHPLSAAWSRYLLRRDVAGQWVAGATEGAYRVKWPMLAWLRKPALEERRAENPGASMALIVNLPSLPPWTGVDYDPRVPGAAQFASAWRGLTDGWRAASREFDAPVIGPADWIWYWADALDFWRVQPEFAKSLLHRPLRPEFSLFRLRKAGVGLLPPPVETTEPAADAAWDAWASALLWYGLQPDSPPGVPSTAAARARRMTAEISLRTRGCAPVRIAYHDGRELVGGVAAAAAGADASLARLYLRYEPDLELWIHRGDDGPWNVAVGREDWALPKEGWVARGEGFFAFSGIIDGGRADYLEQGDQIFFDPRGVLRTVREIAADGPVQCRRERAPDGWRWTIEALGELSSVAVRPPQPAVAAVLHAEAFDGDGVALDEPRVETAGDWLRVAWPAGAARLHVTWRMGP